MNIPFETAKQVNIAQQTLSADPVLKPDQSRISYVNKNTSLDITVEANDDRTVRVTVNNLLENLKTVIECFEQFDKISYKG